MQRLIDSRRTLRILSVVLCVKQRITGLTSGGFIDVQYLMQAANAVLGQVSPGTPDPNQAFEAALIGVFQAANANSDFVTQELLWGLVGTFV